MCSRGVNTVVSCVGPCFRCTVAAMSVVTREDIDLLLQTTVATTKSFVEAMFNSQQSQINQLITENVELKRSLEFAQGQLGDLQQAFDCQAAAVATLQTNQGMLTTIENRVRVMEDFSRAVNLIITGIGEQQGETTEQAMLKIQKIISNNLQLPNVKVQHAYRIRQQGDGTQSRAILAKLPSADDKIKCLRVSSKLKGKDI